MSFKGIENGSAINVGCDMMVKVLEVTISMMNFRYKWKDKMLRNLL